MVRREVDHRRRDPPDVHDADAALADAGGQGRRERSLSAHWNTPVYHEGYVYASSGRHTYEAELRCVEWKTGKVMWSQPDLTRASLLYVDGHFLCLGEDGMLRLLKASPQRYEEIAAWEPMAAQQPAQPIVRPRPLLRPPCWAAPILSHGLLYVRGDDPFVDDHVRRAVDHGYAAFCLTVDTALYSRRERDLARRFVKPWRLRATGHQYQAALSWDHVKRFKDTHAVPLILKGIATAEDAELACDHGVEVVYVSNHGGRQLDHGRASIDVLPEVVRAVGGRARVMVDGGFVRGTDIVKALALGADVVGLGRLACCGLAAAGAPGLVRALELLEDEIRICLGLLGVDRIGALDPSYLHAAPPVTLPHATSAFPLLDEEGY